MNITVYGKPDCKMCQDFKSKLKLLGVEWKEVDVTDLIGMWLRDPAAASDAMSVLQMIDGKLPAVQINGMVMWYPEAIRFLKNLLKKSEGKRDRSIEEKGGLSHEELQGPVVHQPQCPGRGMAESTQAVHGGE